MSRKFITVICFILLGLGISGKAQEKLNLDPTTSPRFEVPDRVWPANIGEASVCLWDDDKLAAFTITIDDNNEQDIAFWKSMGEKYNFNFTWFVITQATNSTYNVQDWDKFRALVEAGHLVDGHDDRNWYNNPSGDEVNSSLEEYRLRLLATQDKVKSEIGAEKDHCWSYAYPFGEGNSEEARKVFISIRGTNGLLNQVDKVNYLDVNSVSNPHIYADQTSRDKYILPLLSKSSTLYGTSYYRGWGCTHFHSVSTTESKSLTESFLQYLAARSSDLWVDCFTRVAQYAQSYATHTLVVDQIEQTEVKFTLTDEMRNDAFDYPLSVKLRVSNDWVNVSASQNGEVRNARLVINKGNAFVIVKAIPDGGQVTVTGLKDSDPAIITTIEDQSVQEGESLEIPFSASTNAGDVISFSVDGLPGFGELFDLGNNSGKLVFTPAAYDKGTYPVVLLAFNGRSQASESFLLSVTDEGSTHTILADLNDASVYFPTHNFVDPNNRTFAIGGGGYVEGKQMSPVFPFLLPQLPADLEVVDAKFVVNLESKNASENITGHLDLYGLPARSGAAVLVSDGYAGNYNQDANAFAIQSHFADANTPIGLVESSVDATENLVHYLNTQYQSAQPGDYVFLRLSNDDLNQQMYSRLMFTTADGALTDESISPTLIIRFGKHISTSIGKVEERSLLVYPTSVKDGQVFIKSSNFRQGETVSVKIFSISGQLFFQQMVIASREVIQVNTGNILAKGMYVMSVVGNGFKVDGKLVVD